MSKLVDKERLAKLAKALDDRAKAYVATEKERALAAEQAIEAKADANATAIAAINNEETGLLKQAKDYADGVAKTEKERAEEQEGLLTDRIETLEGIVGSEAEGAFGEVKAAVTENTAAIAKLNGEANEEGSVKKAVADAVKAEEDRAKEVEEDHETRIAANAAAIAAQPAIDAEQDRRLGVLEGLISGGEGDDNALTQLQKSIDTAQAAAEAAQADVDAVEQRLDAEDGLVDRIEAVETFKNTTYPAAEAKVREDFAAADTALHTTISAEIDADVLEETSRAVAKENELDAAIKAEAQTARAAEKANADEIAKQKDADQAGTLAHKIAANAAAIEKEATDRATAVSEEAQAREAADNALDGRLDVIEGTGEGSIKKALDDAKAHAQGLVDAVNTAAGNLEDRVEANEAKLAGLANATVKAEIEAAQAAAEKHADDAITALVDSAPEAMNTLNELAKAIKDNKDIYDGYIAEHATAMANMKSELQKEIDDDVAAEAALREAADTQIRKDFAAADATLKADLQKEIDDDVKVEKERAVAEEAKIRGEFAAADTALSNRIKVFEAGGAQDVAAKEARLAAAETFIQEHSHEELQGEIDAVEGRVGALETFKNGHSHSTMEQGIADNKAAIEKEVEDRASAIAEALKVYSTTEEMKGIIGNVVNSLALTMENDQVVLKLGGVDGIALTSVDLDLATDDDIDTIIAGLDKKIE